MSPPPRWLPVPFLPLAMAGLFIGVWGGLSRLGWPVSPPTPALPAYHGALMVSGFFGTVIALERAVAGARLWGFAAPALSAAGVALLALVEEPIFGLSSMALAGAVLTALYGVVLVRQPTFHLSVMALGAVVWCAGNILWAANWPSYGLWPFWSTFLVLTIAGERLELSRVLDLSRGKRAIFVLAVLVIVGGVATAGTAYVSGLYEYSSTLFAVGTRMVAGGFLGLALWLLKNDLARKNLPRPGLPRFVAVSLISGYLWLAFAGGLGLWSGPDFATPLYDALLHSLFLGFVFVMVIAHAPIVFPTILGMPIGFHRWFYVPLTLVHLSVLARVAADFAGWLPGRQWAGVLNIVGLIAFFVSMLVAVGIGTAPARETEPAPRSGNDTK